MTVTASPALDLVIRGGLVVDGSGRPPFAADVGISAGRIAVVGKIAGSGREEIEASGRLVVPGFIDIHTHFDGQVTWENRLRPSSEHGVTTVVMGNCGVGFAPCRPHQRDMLVKVMSGVEDIPEIVLTEGVPWEWTTFPEYLDFVASRRFDADCAAYVPHAALRVFVMGWRGYRREASTADDRKRMTALVAEAVSAGAAGVSTSRLLSHRDSSGALAPHVQSEREEMLALAEGLRQAGKGIFQVASGLANQQLASAVPGAAPLGPEESARREVALFVDICRASGRPLTFALSIINDQPATAKLVLDLVADANREPGISMIAQVFPRPIGILFGLDLSLHPFKLHPSYREIEHLPLAERVREMRKPERRALILSEQPDPDHPDPIQRFLVQRSLDTYPFADKPDYEPDLAGNLRQTAMREARPVEALAYDAILAADGRALLFLPINNFPGSLDQTGDMLVHPDTVVALGDAGAHLGLISDGSYPTFLLSYWTRDRTKGTGPRLDLAQAVHRLTLRPAQVAGMTDRGLIAVGMKADINVISYDDLQLGLPEAVYDLPGNGRRLSQKAEGIDATIVSGVPTYRHGRSTGALPGRLLRI